MTSWRVRFGMEAWKVLHVHSAAGLLLSRATLFDAIARIVILKQGEEG